MKRLTAAGATHVGRVREHNEDAILVRSSVFAVADGMGGHQAGEVASATAIGPIAELDGRVFPDAQTAVAALREAVVRANTLVCDLAAERPEYHGMGTTLTAALLEGRRLHVAHVGDSRAYLLRGGTFNQLTDDHTLVQGLIDEGQITPAEAEVHPHRSVITRAIGVLPAIDVDSMSIELEPGDQLLLCSDGLSGVVPDAEIAATLAERTDPARTVDRLVELANDGGGPDNVTVLLLRFDDADAPRPPALATTITIDTSETRVPSDDRAWAATYGRLGRGRHTAVGPDGGTGSVAARLGNAPRVFGRAVAIVLSTLLLVAVVVGGARFLLDRSYYVGVDAGELVIFQGVSVEVPLVPLSRVRERTGVMLTDVPAYLRPAFEEGRPAIDLEDARRLVAATPRSTRADAGAGAGG